jgi:hypothetical protein
MPKPSIALYLGETYASLGLFDLAQKSKPVLSFEKSVFLPQVSLKNLLGQTKVKLQEIYGEQSEPVPVYVVTKYFDRLKQFRLGGSISQVIAKGYENSYSLKDSRFLSLAASQLIIALETEQTDKAFLQSELERIKKINPDLNKVVVALPESKFSAAKVEKVVQFFTEAGLKIFLCAQPHNQNELRKTLLNAGSEGTREEITKDLMEAFGANSEIFYFCHSGFQKKFENAELFNSANNFFAQMLKKKNLVTSAYFDIESFKSLKTLSSSVWQSPWGNIPINHYQQDELGIHPFAELKLNHISMLDYDKSVSQLEPGPVLAGRAIKPLVLDLFWAELQNNEFCKNLFSTVSQDLLKIKILNIFSVLEKGQKSSTLTVSAEDLKKAISQTLADEITLISGTSKRNFTGPLASVFSGNTKQSFSWPHEIISMAGVQSI